MGGILSDMEATMQSGDVEVLRKQIYDIFRQKDEELQRFKNDVIKHERQMSVNLNELTKDVKILHNINIAQFDLLSKAGQIFSEVIRVHLNTRPVKINKTTMTICVQLQLIKVHCYTCRHCLMR